MKVLVTGGVRSGKSRHAEELVLTLAGDGPATYVAPGPTTDHDRDPDWAARVAAHRARRPAAWGTIETRDVAAALREGSAPVLVDCLGTWLTGVLDEERAWEPPLSSRSCWSGVRTGCWPRSRPPTATWCW